MALKQVSLEQIQLGINPITRMLQVKQGDNVIHLTRNQILGLKNLKENKYETNTYTSQITPRNKFKLTDSGSILMTCNDQYHEATVLLNRIGYKGIMQYTEAHKGKIAWDKDIRR